MMSSSLDSSLILSYWIFMPEVWVILGILLIIADVLLGFSYVLIPFGTASVFTACIVAFSNSDFLFSLQYKNRFLYEILDLQYWQDVIYWFAFFSVIAVLVLRKVTMNKKDHDDINQY